MNRLIIIILMMLLVPANYVSAEDKETVDIAKDKTLILLKGYLPLVAKYNYVYFKERMTKEDEIADFLGSMEEQRRIIGFDRMGAGGEIINPLNEYENEKINTSSFCWIIIPNIKESQPSGIIQFTYSF
ncbi:MAG: hypothetical protein R6W88_08700 [Desulfobacterales bacterium]